MALFSRLRGKAKTPQQDAMARNLLIPSVFVMTVDGALDKSELVQLANGCSFSPIFAGMPGDKIVAMLESILNELAKGNVDQIIPAAIDAMPMALRETSLAFAVRVAFADGHVHKNEAEVLKLLAQQMGVSQDTFASISQVMAMLQRGLEQAA